MPELFTKNSVTVNVTPNYATRTASCKLVVMPQQLIDNYTRQRQVLHAYVIQFLDAELV